MMQLADTNIVSELMRKRPDPGVLAWREMVDAMYGHITMSAVTVDEIMYGLRASKMLACRPGSTAL